MNKKAGPADPWVLFDHLAVGLQRLKSESKVRPGQPLIRIDYRREAGKAPFQFDSDNAVLHRTGCKAIPQMAMTALYAVWYMNPEDAIFACKKCRPMPEQNKLEQNVKASDLLFGLLSIVDQFGTVLYERGKEFRESPRGREVEQMLGGAMSVFDDRQKEVAGVALSTMETLLRLVNEFHGTVSGDGQGAATKKGKGASSVRPKRRSQRKK